MMLYIYTDGAARGNPGPSASGYQIYDKDHKLMIKASLFNGFKTNNFAEYYAVISALERVSKEFGFDVDVQLSSDSELIVHQLKGDYKVKDAKLKALNKMASELIHQFRHFNIYNVPRSNRHISAVDKELNLLLDRIKYRKDGDIKETTPKGGKQKTL